MTTAPIRSLSYCAVSHKSGNLRAAVINSLIHCRIVRLRLLRGLKVSVVVAVDKHTGVGGTLTRLDLHVASRRVFERFEHAVSRDSRRDFGPIVFSEPLQPVRPPRAWMLRCVSEPGFDIADGRPIDPVAVFDLIRRVDYARDVTGAGDHERDPAAEKLRPEEYGFRRRNVILSCREHIDRNGDVAEVDRVAGEHHLAFGELVVEIAVAQIKRMTCSRDPRRVGVPAEKVKRPGWLAL